MKVKPIGFIRKAHVNKELKNVIDNLIAEMARKKQIIMLTDGKKLVNIPIRLVMYFYSERDYVIIKYHNGETNSIRQKLSVVENVVKQYNFIRIHNRYLINMRKIEKSSKENITMKNMECLPISRKYLKNVQVVTMTWFRRSDT